jgi:hypothetical protein
MYKIIGANNTEYGPISADQIRQWITEGRINAQTSAQAVGDTAWKPISSFPEFASHFPSTIHASPSSGAPSGAPPPAAPIPPLGGPGSGGDGRQQALNQVSGPAIGLIITGALTICFSAFLVLAQIFGLAAHAFDNMANQNPQFAQMLQASSGAMGILFALLRMVLGGFVIYGGIKMKSLEQHGVVMAAAILSVIPCCLLGPCCCISIPLGIWALIVSNKPEVKSYFV